ncbi:hypothetical protein RND71_034250 [Anisodus tanguticus]|uniref:Uncharacterized protein n=1 Tax=Anisodus tanguticus TaxID=243964 RepID=A0AAE1R9S7_9SOLA|nr:hypothetical protein RND71_034250 [Anisodus tanguticus]
MPSHILYTNPHLPTKSFTSLFSSPQLFFEQPKQPYSIIIVRVKGEASRNEICVREWRIKKDAAQNKLERKGVEATGVLDPIVNPDVRKEIAKLKLSLSAVEGSLHKIQVLSSSNEVSKRKEDHPSNFDKYIRFSSPESSITKSEMKNLEIKSPSSQISQGTDKSQDTERNKTPRKITHNTID